MYEVKCSKLKEKREGLEAPPFPGDIGKLIWENVSQEAWDDWLNVQLAIINEYHLELAEPEHRELLENQMLVYLCLKEDDEVQLLDLGLVPE